MIPEDTCPPMFTAAVFTIARAWEQPRCPSADKGVKKTSLSLSLTRTHGMKSGHPAFVSEDGILSQEAPGVEGCVSEVVLGL